MNQLFNKGQEISVCLRPIITFVLTMATQKRIVLIKLVYILNFV